MRDAVVERWGEEVAPDGAVDRSAVAAAAFAGPSRAGVARAAALAAGGRAGRCASARTAAQPHPPPRAAVVETPLLFEAGMEGVYDATIAVVADEDVRAERAGARGHEAVDERAARQLPQAGEGAARRLRGSQRGNRGRARTGAVRRP